MLVAANTNRPNTLDAPTILCLVMHDPEFADGVQLAREVFTTDACEEDLTEAEIVKFLADEISPELQRRVALLNRAMGLPPLSFAHRMGFIVGWLSAAFASSSVLAPLSPIESARSCRGIEDRAAWTAAIATDVTLLPAE